MTTASIQTGRPAGIAGNIPLTLFKARGNGYKFWGAKAGVPPDPAPSERLERRATFQEASFSSGVPRNTSYVIRNHTGIGAGRSEYDEGALIVRTVASLGHQIELIDPGVGLNEFEFRIGDRVIIATQPAGHNDLLKRFVLKHRYCRIAWRPGWAQLPLIDNLLQEARPTVVHLCAEKAARLTRRTSPSDSAEALNELSPETMIVVSNSAAAVACQFGRVVKVLVHAIENPINADGNGAAFFGGFIGGLFSSNDVPTCLALGHDFGAAAAAGRWK